MVRMRRRPPAIQVFIVMATTFFAAACGSAAAPSTPPAEASGAAVSQSPDGSMSPRPASIGGPEVVAAASAIDAAKTGDPVSMGTLQSLRFTDTGTQAARQRIEAGATGDALWAATWLYATAGTDPAPLVPLLTNEDSTIRVMAAAALMALGSEDGFDVLVDAISSDDQLRGSEPPTTVARFAARTLDRYTDAGLSGPAGTPAEKAESARRWSAWLEASHSSLRFDAETGMWASR